MSSLAACLGALPVELPVPSLGTKLDNESLKIALGLRLRVFPLLLSILVFVVVTLMYMVLMVCYVT